MDDTLKAAILNAKVAAVQAEITGMVEENEERRSNGYASAYNTQAFNERRNEILALVTEMESSS